MGYITLWIPVFTGMTTFARGSMYRTCEFHKRHWSWSQVPSSCPGVFVYDS